MLAVMAWLLQAGASSIAPALPSAAQASNTVRLPAGTQIRFVTNSELHSRSLIQGQRFGLTVAENVLVGTTMVIPRGASAVGEVESLSEKGMFGKSAKFVLRPLFIELGGTRVNLDGASPQRGKRAVTEAAITTVLTGGLGVFITGKSAKLPAGSDLYGSVRNDAMVTPPGS